MELKNEFSEFAASRVCYELSLEIDPDNATTHNNFALLLWVCLHEPNAAADQFLRALAIDPKDGNVHGNYAHFLAQTMNDQEGATSHFELAMKLSPNNNGTPANYAALLVQQGELATAWSFCQRSHRLCLSDPDRIMARPLLCAAVILLLQRHNASVPLGQIKKLFARGVNHVGWILTALLEVLEGKLSKDSYQLMRAISDTISDKRYLDNLESNPIWRSVRPVALDTPWPEC